MIKNKIKFVFFGTSRFATLVLDEMKKNNLYPSLIVTTEDKPKGRKLIMTAPETKIWAEKENIPFIQPRTLKNEEIESQIKSLCPDADVFIVASYGKIIPKNVLYIPKYKTLNVHPSLLPELRGASPIQSFILEGKSVTGVTIMRLDEEMDHGPILSQKKIELNNKIPYTYDLETDLAKIGGEMLVEVLPDWISGNIKEIEQDHTKATYCKKIEKQDGHIDLSGNPQENLRKIRAYHIWPGAFTYFKHGDKDIRVVIKTANLDNQGNLILEKVIPEGKKEMKFEDFKRGLR